MQTLTDQQLKDADQETRRWWARVYQLVNDTACSLEHAIKAIQAADKEQAQCN